MRKVPTDNDYYSYDGGSCRQIWNQLPHEWQCPACKRTKREVLRWGHSGYKGNKKEQWYAPFHTHHDHTKGVRERCCVQIVIPLMQQQNENWTYLVPGHFTF